MNLKHSQAIIDVASYLSSLGLDVESVQLKDYSENGCLYGVTVTREIPFEAPYTYALECRWYADDGTVSCRAI